MHWDAINAYVDGELSPEEAKAIAERAAQDPVLRARIATLSRLKDTTARALRSAEPLPTSAPSPRAAWGMAAAGAALFLLATGLMVDLSKPPDQVETGIEVYRSWLVGAAPAGAPQPGTIEVGTWQGSPPDLRAAHLRLVLMVPKKDSGQGVLLGYEGPHGCRVGLWISRSANVAGEPHGTGGDIQTVLWEVDGTGFVLLAHGMDKARLATLAGAVEHLTRERDPDQVRVALGHSAELGPPCTG